MITFMPKIYQASLRIRINTSLSGESPLLKSLLDKKSNVTQRQLLLAYVAILPKHDDKAYSGSDNHP